MSLAHPGLTGVTQQVAWQARPQYQARWHCEQHIILVLSVWQWKQQWVSGGAAAFLPFLPFFLPPRLVLWEAVPEEALEAPQARLRGGRGGRGAAGHTEAQGDRGARWRQGRHGPLRDLRRASGGAGGAPVWARLLRGLPGRAA